MTESTILTTAALEKKISIKCSEIFGDISDRRTKKRASGLKCVADWTRAELENIFHRLRCVTAISSRTSACQLYMNPSHPEIEPARVCVCVCMSYIYFCCPRLICTFSTPRPPGTVGVPPPPPPSSLDIC